MTTTAIEITDEQQASLEENIASLEPHEVDAALQLLLVYGKPYASEWAQGEIEARRAARTYTLRSALDAHIE